jgi:hypothetical protein
MRKEKNRKMGEMKITHEREREREREREAQ